jgi:hypothetical protein
MLEITATVFMCTPARRRLRLFPLVQGRRKP